MTQPEARISRQIQSALRAQGHFVFKVHGSPLMMAGLPDLIVCARGKFVGMEVKQPHLRANTSERQKYVHKLITDAGGLAVVVCSAAEALRVIAELDA